MLWTLLIGIVFVQSNKEKDSFKENDIGIWVESDEPIDDELIDADTEVVEGGIIKEALKTLAIGGLVRLTGKLVGKDIADALK